MNQPSQSFLIRMWWHNLPLAAARWSDGLCAILSDGAFLQAWPVVAALLPPIAGLIGFYAGWQRIIPGETYTFSVGVMALLLCAGGLGASLGFCLCAGYAIGDLLLFRTQLVGLDVLISSPGAVLVRVGLPAVLLYLLLGTLVVTMPLVSQSMRLSLWPLVRNVRPAGGRLLFESVLVGALYGLLVFAWAQIVPPLIRPVYTWVGRVPPVEAVQPLQSHGIVLAAIGACIGVIRVYLEYKAMDQPEAAAHVRGLSRAIRALSPVRRLVLPLLLSSALRAVFTSFLMAGLLSNWTEALLFTVVLASIFALRNTIPRSPIGRSWVHIVGRIPLAFRLLAGVGIAYAFGTAVITPYWSGANTFRPMLIATAGSLLVFTFLLPSEVPAETATNGRAAGASV